MLARHRAEQIERLHAYAESGVFPHNYTSAEPLHMFKDGAGRMCAVANLVHKDGITDLVDQTSREHNEVALADVKSGPLLDWALGSGLTMEEVARIQRPAPMMRPSVVVRPSKPPAVANAPIKTPVPVMANIKPLRDEAAMQRELRAHFAAVEHELNTATEASLDVAVERWLAANSNN